MSYMEEIPSKDGLARFGGVYLTQPGSAAIIQPLGGKKGRTIFRVLPQMVDGVEQPFRLGDEPNNFSHWIKAEKIIRMAGVTEKFTAFTRVKGKDRATEGPIDKFARAFHKQFKDIREGKAPNPGFPQDWFTWTLQQGPLPRVEMGGLIQGLLFENAGKEFKGPDGRWKPQMPVLLTLPKTAREGLEALCNKEVEGYTGDLSDYASRFMCGDFLSLANGKPLQFSLVPGSGTVFAHYETTVLTNTIPLTPAQARSWTPWDKLLRFLTTEEQMELLVKHFPSEAVDYVFGHSEWTDLLPQGVKGRWDARSRAASGGYGAMPVPTAQPYAQPMVTQPTMGYPAMQTYQVPAQVAVAPGGAPFVTQPMMDQDMGGDGEPSFDVDFGGTASAGVATTPSITALPPMTGTPVTTDSSVDSRAAMAKARLAQAQASAQTLTGKKG